MTSPRLDPTTVGTAFLGLMAAVNRAGPSSAPAPRAAATAAGGAWGVFKTVVTSPYWMPQSLLSTLGFSSTVATMGGTAGTAYTASVAYKGAQKTTDWYNSPPNNSSNSEPLYSRFGSAVGETLSEPIRDAASYVVQAGGKALEPVLEGALDGGAKVATKLAQKTGQKAGLLDEENEFVPMTQHAKTAGQTLRSGANFIVESGKPQHRDIVDLARDKAFDLYEEATRRYNELPAQSGASTAAGACAIAALATTIACLWKANQAENPAKKRTMHGYAVLATTVTVASAVALYSLNMA